MNLSTFTVEMKKNAEGPAKLLIKHISDTDNICSWNKTLKRSEVLRRISDTVSISYHDQVSLYFDAYTKLYCNL